MHKYIRIDQQELWLENSYLDNKDRKIGEEQ
jgi:hypothetical protein